MESYDLKQNINDFSVKNVQINYFCYVIFFSATRMSWNIKFKSYSLEQIFNALKKYVFTIFRFHDFFQLCFPKTKRTKQLYLIIMLFRDVFSTFTSSENRKTILSWKIIFLAHYKLLVLPRFQTVFSNLLTPSRKK